ncbi:MAG: hypothetical protein U0794_18740 [Isosphaeraceae bacterium]
MRIRTRRRLSWPAAAALAFALGAPSLAHAQQGGLFPLAPIRRERVPCQMEDPVYRLYRQEYFGYHPTCWRRFPTGWGCPSPEAPNAAEAFRLLPRDKPPADLGPDMGEEPPPDGRPAPDRGAEAPGNPPPLPSGERSPFELDKPGTTPPTATPGTGTNPPGGIPPATRPGGERSPFEIDPQPSAPDAVKPAPAGGLPPVPGGDAPAPPAPPRDAASPAGPSAAAEPAGAEPPLLALPDPTVGPTSAVSSNALPLPETPNGTADSAGPARAPRRTSFIGNLFNRGIRRR